MILERKSFAHHSDGQQRPTTYLSALDAESYGMLESPERLTNHEPHLIRGQPSAGDLFRLQEGIFEDTLWSWLEWPLTMAYPMHGTGIAFSIIQALGLNLDSPVLAPLLR